MAEKILIMGESGTGKSTSIRNCDPSITAIVNPVGKPLPFRGSKSFTTLNGVTDSDKICDFMKEQAFAGKKIIIVDDFQYILAIPYMNRIKETGWDKYNDFGANYFSIIDVCNDLPEDVCVYYLTHCETLENGLTTVKLIGKLLREKITVEGLFTIVLRTGTSEGKYYFFTQNNGKDTVKSPLGMFDSFSIDNDLKYVDDKIRNYYEFDNAKSDAEIAELDNEKAGEVEKPEPRRRRTRITDPAKVAEEVEKVSDVIESAEAVEIITEEKTARRRRERSRTDESQKEEVSSSEEIHEGDTTGDPGSKETDRPVNTGRRRKTHDEVVAENEEKTKENLAAIDAAIDEIADGREEIPFEEVPEVEMQKLDPVPRRKLSEAKPEEDEKFVNIPDEVINDNSEEVKEEPKRRTRKVRS